MGIDRDDCDERQARIEWMIDEFRQARSRRLVKVRAVPDPQHAAGRQPAAGDPVSPASPAIPLTRK